MRSIFLFLLLFSLLQACARYGTFITISWNGTSRVTIVPPDHPSVTQEFAAAELARYLEEISDAAFEVINGKSPGPVIRLTRDSGIVADQYTISSDSRDITLAGNSDRALLYAVYDFLERLGCRWLAPEFLFYKGHASVIPSQSNLNFPRHASIRQSPVFKYRKVDLAEGKSADPATVAAIIDWMPRNRFNTLMVPMDLNNRGRMVWDDFRRLVPELKKRGIVLEVGQHGYQNFLNAGMQEGKLFELHPDWFGRDRECHPSPKEECVFNTSNPDALEFFLTNFLEYIRQHPEIDVFDLWPPDNASWGDCKAEVSDPPKLRQARLAERVREAARGSDPGLRIEIIAFARTLQYAPVDSEIMVDVCPINQSFEKQIFDSSSVQNYSYASAVQDWRNHFRGDLGIYTYYRKYAWKSLPNLIPHYMQSDLKWYASLPVQGISCYAEPGDWFTYELNHYILGRLEWNPDADVDSLIASYCVARYAGAWQVGVSACNLLEETVRYFGNIRNSTLKKAAEISMANARIDRLLEEISFAQTNVNSMTGQFLDKLARMLQYARLDLKIQEQRASGAGAGILDALLKDLASFLDSTRGQGILIVGEHEDIGYLERHYGVFRE